MELSLFTSLVCFAQCLLVIRASGFALQERATATPSPIAVTPAQNWDGNDGPWSSFTMRVGTPAQNIRVFVSTSSPDTWVVLPSGCSPTDSDCIEKRGRIYNYNQSSTWSEHGYYELGTQQNLNISVQALFGNETVGLGIQGSGGPTLENQIIGAFASPQLYLGMFGLNPASTNFTSENQGRPSYMTTLKNQSLLPSLSFGYTAGAKYRLKQVLGSLTLGGIDSSRFTPSDLSIPFAPDPSRNLMVGLQSIRSVDQGGQSTDLLPTGIMSLVDSTVPQIWLPVEACQAFERAFGLTFDETSELYLVNTTLHDQLNDQNASFTFTLGAATAGGPTTDVTLPYKSFDLLVTPPTNGVANSSRYFPLRRAANDTQYTLGRTFLQEAYLTVDWERQNFSLSQCRFEDDMSQTLVPIASIDDQSSSSKSAGSSSGKIAGIAVGVVVGVLLITGAICTWLFLRHKRNKQDAQEKQSAEGSDANDSLIRQGYDGKGELPGSIPNPPKPDEHHLSEWVNEKADHPGYLTERAEAEGAGTPTPELIGSSQQQRAPFQRVHEMSDPSALVVPSPTSPPIELPASQPQTGELDGCSAASSPGFFARRPRNSNAASPISHSSPRRRSLRERLSSRPEPSRTSTLNSLPSLTSSAGVVSAPSPAPPVQGNEEHEIPVGAGHSGEPFSPVSRQGTFSQAPANRTGTADQVGSPLFGPVSPNIPETARGLFERLKGSGGNSQDR